MRERDDLRGAVDEPLDVVGAQAAVIGDAEPTELGAGLRADLLPWHEVGVVLHLGDDDAVPGSEDEPVVHEAGIACGERRGIGEGVGRQVQ
jgi:hypothetical protein